MGETHSAESQSVEAQPKKRPRTDIVAVAETHAHHCCAGLPATDPSVQAIRSGELLDPDDPRFPTVTATSGNAPARMLVAVLLDERDGLIVGVVESRYTRSLSTYVGYDDRITPDRQQLAYDAAYVLFTLVKRRRRQRQTHRFEAVRALAEVLGSDVFGEVLRAAEDGVKRWAMRVAEEGGVASFRVARWLKYLRRRSHRPAVTLAARRGMEALAWARDIEARKAGLAVPLAPADASSWDSFTWDSAQGVTSRSNSPQTATSEKAATETASTGTASTDTALGSQSA
ncbi:MAG: hypothetical protein AAFQ53_08775 [Bacteroidota bacterium]